MLGETVQLKSVILTLLTVAAGVVVMMIGAWES
jgi:hypothetical protein